MLLSHLFPKYEPIPRSACGKHKCRGCVFEAENGWARAHVFDRVSVKMTPTQAEVWLRDVFWAELQRYRREELHQKGWQDRPPKTVRATVIVDGSVDYTAVQVLESMIAQLTEELGIVRAELEQTRAQALRVYIPTQEEFEEGYKA